MGRAPVAERTVTFFRAKPGHYSLEGLRRCGSLSVVDIGIPRAVLKEIAPRLWLNAPALWQHKLRRGDRGDHKYARGHATILGGDTYIGAHSIIGSNVWLMKSVPAESVAYFKGENIVIRSRRKKETMIERSIAIAHEHDWEI
jgi:hypothetical protein